MRRAIGVAAVLAVVVPLAVAQSGEELRLVEGASDVRAEESISRSAVRMPGRYADARHCLDFSTNMQVIMCAEKYLPMRAAPGNGGHQRR